MLRTALRASRRVQAVALQQQRAFAEKAVAAETFDWDAVAELVHSDEGKRELASLRSTYADIKERLEGLAKEPAPINWAQWKKEIDPAVVDVFQKAYESMALPDFPGAELLQDASAQFAGLIKEAEVMAAHSEKRVKEIELELQNIEKEKARVATMTVDEELASDPALAEEIDKEVAEKHFMP